MFNEIITLVSAGTTTTNIYGDVITTEATADIFAELKSIGQTEFWQAQAAGFKPELKFVIQDYRDYDNQKIIEYDDVRYTVLRTYKTQSDQLEIVVKRGVDDT